MVFIAKSRIYLPILILQVLKNKKPEIYYFKAINKETTKLVVTDHDIFKVDIGERVGKPQRHTHTLNCTLVGQKIFCISDHH